MAASKVAIPALPHQTARKAISDAALLPSPRSREKKIRASKPKLRSGCLTCKLTSRRIRHIKCDETKPNCERCTSTGRACDGYASSSQKTPMHAIQRPPSATSVLTRWELRAFSHFRERSAPVLSSFFDSYLWAQLVLQMSLADPAVRHAVIAFDTLSEKMSYSTSVFCSASDQASRRPNENWRYDSFAILQYNKAIESLARRSETEPSTDVVALVCVLFICIEALRGGVETAIMHFNGGMRTAVSQMSMTSGDASIESMKRMQHHILPPLCRVELLSLLFGNSPSWPYPLDLNEVVPHEFTSARAARDSMIHLMNIIMRFVREVTGRRYERRLTHDDYSRRNALRRALQDWSSKHDILILNTPVSGENLSAAQMLRMHHLTARIMLLKCTEDTECASDRFLPEFEMAVQLVESIVGTKAYLEKHSDRKSGIFLLDMELVSPVYFVAAKCRHPKIRRRAVTLLRSLKRREGFFDSSVAAALAERIANIEEVNLTVLDGSEWPPEKDRIHHTDIKTAFEVDGTRCKSTFFMKPYGVDGPWLSLQEEFGVSLGG